MDPVPVYKTPLGKYAALESDVTVRRAYEFFGGWDLFFLRDQAFPDGVGTLIDVGAHVGLVSLPVAMANPGVKVHAFEPHPRNAQILRYNAEQNGVADRVTVHEAAVSSRRDDLFYPSLTDTVDGRLAPPGGEKEGYFGEHLRAGQSVKVVGLMDAIGLTALGAPVVMKVDVQGQEMNVLRSIGGCRVDMLLLEIWPYGLTRAGETPESVYEMISGHYWCAVLLGGKVELQPASGFLWPLLKSLSWTDQRCVLSLVLAR